MILTPPATVLQCGIGPGRWAITSTGLRTPTGLEIRANEMYCNLAILAAPDALLAIAHCYFGLRDPLNGGGRG